MLHAQLWENGDYRVDLGHMAERYCAHCRNWTIEDICPADGVDLDLPYPLLRKGPKRLVKVKNSGFTLKYVWTCPQCGNLFFAYKCLDQCPTTRDHDRCPACGSEHGMNGRQHRKSKVYVYYRKNRPGPTVGDFDRRAGDPPIHFPRLRELLEHVRSVFEVPWQRKLVEVLKQWILAGNERFISFLLPTDEEPDWPAMHEALEDCPDRPPSEEALREAYERKVWRSLFEIMSEYASREEESDREEEDEGEIPQQEDSNHE
jgi:hypothetical protein